MQEELRKEAPSEDIVLTILDILRRREEKDPPGITEAATASWGRCAGNSETERPAQLGKWLPKMAVCAMVLCLLIVAVPKAQCTKNIFQLLAQWTETVFSFSQRKDPDAYVYKTDNPDLQRIYDAVADCGVTDPVVPTWLPDGFELDTLELTEHAGFERVCVRLNLDDKYIKMSFDICAEDNFRNYAKDDAHLKEIEINGIKHYIAENDGEFTASWSLENVECALSANCPESELYHIIQSIYQSEVN